MATQLSLAGIGAPVLGRGADISRCLRYRYALWRSWDGPLPATEVLFVMLNPSTADGHVDDPTIRKCVGFAQRWEHSVLRVVNLFAYRATDPRKLARVAKDGNDIIGPENPWRIGECAAGAQTVVLAWGNSIPKALLGRAAEVVDQLRRAAPATPLMCLGRTADGQPRHPRVLAYETPLEAF